MGKKGCSVLHLNLHGTNRKTKTNERYFRRDSISHCLHLGLLELAFSLHGMSVCTVDSIYLRLLLGTLHSLNFTSDCAGGCTCALYLRTIPMSLLLKTTPMNFTQEGIQWTLLGNNSNELYISEQKELYLRTFFKDCSRWYWGHVQLTWFETISLELLVNPILQKQFSF